MPDDSLRLRDKVIVIIGGTTGLGLSAAKAFTRWGGRVVIVGRNPDSLENALHLLGDNADGLAADAVASETAPQAIARAMDRFGGCHGLYHVAGGSGRSRGDGPLHALTDEGWEFTVDLNLTSLIYSNRAALRHFLEEKQSGAILNMGSVLGNHPSPHYFASHAYAATKSAITGFSKSLAAFYAGDNIRVNVVAPALVETPMAQRASEDHAIMKFIRSKQPLDGGRIGRPDDLDAAAAFFLSDDSAFVTGQVLNVDGGWSVMEGQHPDT